MIENEIYDKIYEFMKGKCNKTEHSGEAIYYCLNITCEYRYVCSECLLEELSHFTSHYKFFMPLDQKEKFFKHMNLISFKNFEYNDLKQIAKESNLTIEDIYTNVEQGIRQIINSHKSDNKQKFEKEINENIDFTLQSIEIVNNFSQEIKVKLDKFINLNKKDEFYTLYNSLKSICSNESTKLDHIKKYYEKLKIFDLKSNKSNFVDKFQKILDELIQEQIKFDKTLTISLPNTHKSRLSNTMIQNSSNHINDTSIRLGSDFTFDSFGPSSTFKMESDEIYESLDKMNNSVMNEASSTIKMRLELLSKKIKK